MSLTKKDMMDKINRGILILTTLLNVHCFAETSIIHNNDTPAQTHASTNHPKAREQTTVIEEIGTTPENTVEPEEATSEKNDNSQSEEKHIIQTETSLNPNDTIVATVNQASQNLAKPGAQEHISPEEFKTPKLNGADPLGSIQNLLVGLHDAVAMERERRVALSGIVVTSS